MLPAGGNARIPADGKPPLLLLWPCSGHALDIVWIGVFTIVYLGSSLMSTETEASRPWLRAPTVRTQGHAPKLPDWLRVCGRFLTLASFWASSTDVVYPPGVPILLGVSRDLLQMGDSTWCSFCTSRARRTQTNNILAPCLWHFRRGSPGIRVDDHQGSFEPQHDAHGSTDADATGSVCSRKPNHPLAHGDRPPMIR